MSIRILLASSVAQCKCLMCGSSDRRQMRIKFSGGPAGEENECTCVSRNWCLATKPFDAEARRPTHPLLELLAILLSGLFLATGFCRETGQLAGSSCFWMLSAGQRWHHVLFLSAEPRELLSGQMGGETSSSRKCSEATTSVWQSMPLCYLTASLLTLSFPVGCGCREATDGKVGGRK